MLDHKNGLKMVEFSSSSKKNGIQLVDSPFNENSSDIIFLGKP